MITLITCFVKRLLLQMFSIGYNYDLIGMDNVRVTPPVEMIVSCVK